MNWLKKTLDFGQKIKRFLKKRPTKEDIKKSKYVACCIGPVSREDIKTNLFVCPHCNKHFPISPKERFRIMFDDSKFEILRTPLFEEDVLNWKDIKTYKQRLNDAKLSTGQDCAILVAKGKINGIDVTMGAVNFDFIGGSHGQNEAEAILYAAQHAIDNKTPLILCTSGGGQVMFQGGRALMGMPRSTIAVNELKKTGLPYIVIFCYKTAGGITASYSNLGDFHIAESESAEIIFSGRRVIQGTIKEELPPDLQTAPWLLKKGFCDRIIDRKDLAKEVGVLLSIILKKNNEMNAEQIEEPDLSDKSIAKEAS